MVKPFSANSASKGKGFPHPISVIIASMAKLDAVLTLDRYKLLLPNLKSASRQSIEGGACFFLLGPPSRVSDLLAKESRAKKR
jgi:hypothetical protein